MRPINRRQFIKVGLYGGAMLLIPVALRDLGCAEQDLSDTVSAEGRFFDEHQYRTIEAVTGVIIPEDEDPGAIYARVVDYIDFFLGAFKVDPPRIYAAGPFSGRHGGENGFSVYLPLSRVKEISWRILIEGSQGIPEREFNGPVIGLQEIYTKGIEELDSLAQERYGSFYKELDASKQLIIFSQADPEFRDIVFEHTVEGMYAAPEYGGNKDCVGWEYIHYEGDRQPIGYNRKQVEEPDEEYSSSALSPKEVEVAVAMLKDMLRYGQGRGYRGIREGIV
jgi:hypothetical protein